MISCPEWSCIPEVPIWGNICRVPIFCGLEASLMSITSNSFPALHECLFTCSIVRTLFKVNIIQTAVQSNKSNSRRFTSSSSSVRPARSWSSEKRKVWEVEIYWCHQIDDPRGRSRCVQSSPSRGHCRRCLSWFLPWLDATRVRLTLLP